MDGVWDLPCDARSSLWAQCCPTCIFLMANGRRDEIKPSYTNTLKTSAHITSNNLLLTQSSCMAKTTIPGAGEYTWPTLRRKTAKMRGQNLECTVLYQGYREGLGTINQTSALLSALVILNKYTTRSGLVSSCFFHPFPAMVPLDSHTDLHDDLHF